MIGSAQCTHPHKVHLTRPSTASTDSITVLGGQWALPSYITAPTDRPSCEIIFPLPGERVLVRRTY